MNSGLSIMTGEIVKLNERVSSLETQNAVLRKVLIHVFETSHNIKKCACTDCDLSRLMRDRIVKPPQL